MSDAMPFSGDPLDRSSNERHDEGWLAEQLAAPTSRFLPFWRLQPLTRRASAPVLEWLDASARGHMAPDAEPLLLGRRDGIAYWAIDVSAVEDPAPVFCIEEGLGFLEARGLATLLPTGEAGILAHGRALLDWHTRHRFCSVCGTQTVPKQGGSVRKCENCGAQHFPRTDPVVIMVVWRGDRCVLGRRRNGPPNRYSCVAGYIDQGETIEEAVAREVREEVGLPVDSVVYHASQPWPFPSTLMIGCFAHAASDEIEVDPHELADARWFSRGEVLAALNSPGPDAPLLLPDRVAIAHHIIRHWAESES